MLLLHESIECFLNIVKHASYARPVFVAKGMDEVDVRVVVLGCFSPMDEYRDGELYVFACCFGADSGVDDIHVCSVYGDDVGL